MMSHLSQPQDEQVAMINEQKDLLVRSGFIHISHLGIYWMDESMYYRWYLVGNDENLSFLMLLATVFVEKRTVR